MVDIGAYLGFEVNFTIACFASLGGDQQYAVVGTGSIDSSRTSVLHHLHLLDVLGVDVTEVTTHLTIDDDEGRALACEARTST